MPRTILGAKETGAQSSKEAAVGGRGFGLRWVAGAPGGGGPEATCACLDLITFRP